MKYKWKEKSILKECWRSCNLFVIIKVLKRRVMKEKEKAKNTGAKVITINLC